MVALTYRLARDKWERLHQLAMLEGVSLNQLIDQGILKSTGGEGLPHMYISFHMVVTISEKKRCISIILINQGISNLLEEKGLPHMYVFLPYGGNHIRKKRCISVILLNWLRQKRFAL